jgi:hypothetical protein
MTLYVHAKDPAALLAQIRAQITAGNIQTWRFDQAGDFTHSAAGGQWNGVAWLCPTIGHEVLILQLKGVQGGQPVTAAIYGVFHGRFLEMIFTHFSGQTRFATATPFQ